MLLIATTGLFVTNGVFAQVVSGVYGSPFGNGQTQVVTLTCGAPKYATNSVSYGFTTNQIVTLNSFPTVNFTTASVAFNDGTTIPVPSSTTSSASQPAFVFTGANNLTLTIGYNATVNYVSDLITFTVFTPSTNNVSVTPASSVVIPSDARGPVQIVLESSSDFVNWVSALPGTYGSTYTNRFFRVRAVAQ